MCLPKKITSSALLLICSLSASASVIENLSERDWLSGDSALTYDESTGLEWLDINLTSGMSLNEISASGILNIFRWAMPWEVESLLDAALVGFGNRQSNDLDDNTNAMKWIGYLGMTGSEEELRWTQGYTIWTDEGHGHASVLQMYGVSAIDCDEVIINYGQQCYSGKVNVVESAPVYDYQLGGINSAFSFEEVIATSAWGHTGPAGAMLVRKALSVDAPELSVLSMLLLGILGVGASRKGMKRQGGK